tara:strand:- start:5824 stop:6243 length:420 start_codon:yes stop_codon:yes gene_type:complete
MYKRIDNWQNVLVKELEKPRFFQWGKDDCCLFACDIIEKITGTDPAIEFRGKYNTALGAYKEIKRQGYEGVVDVARKICKKYGWPEVHPNLAQRGDAIAAKFDGHYALGIMEIEYGFFVGESKYVYLERSQIDFAWRIG